MRKKMLLFICSILAISVLLSACQEEKKDDGIAPDSSTSEETMREEISENMIIETTYGNLHFPDQWEDLIQTSNKKDKDSLIVTFKTEIDEQTYKLFDVIIGTAEDGQPVGSLKDSDGTIREVFIRIYSIENDSNLSEGELKRLYAMQEDLNFLIDNLK